MEHDYDFENIELIKYAGQKSVAVTCKRCGVTIFAKNLERLKEIAKYDNDSEN